MARSSAVTGKKVLARIQRLCCAGVGGRMLMPDLMREIMTLVPVRGGVFCWLDPRLEIIDTYSPHSTATMDRYFAEFYRKRREAELIQPYNEILSGAGPGNVVPILPRLRVDHRAFLRSDYYNLLWRPTGFHEPLMVRVREGGRNHGLFYLYREAGTPGFRQGEVENLEAIAGFVAHGMARPVLEERAFVEGDDRALFVVETDGRMLHASSQSRRLLRMAFNPVPSSAAAWHGDGLPEIARLCRALTGISEAREGQKPPVLKVRNPWGEFVLRAYWFGAGDGTERTRHVGITIERRVSRFLALLRRIETLDLTTREKQLCLLLVRDQAQQEDLADAMGVAASTVITHQRSIYAKIGVHSRAGLIAALHADSVSG